MTFLLPAAWSLLALAAPITALYLIKTRLRRRPVTTLLFWEQLKPPVYTNSLWRKLRRWLSLLLQIAFLALLTFALARPRVGWETGGSRALVLVLDASPSLLATDVSPNRWERALQLARQQVAALRFSDQCAVILAENPPRVLSGWTSNRRTLDTVLDAARDAPKRTVGRGEGIRDALVLARRLAAGRVGSGVTVISDGAWADPPDASALTGIDLSLVGTGQPVNSALTTFAARRSLAAPGDFLVSAEVAHFGPAPVDGELETLENGHLLDLQPLHLEPGKPWRKTWKGHSENALKFEAHLRMFANSTHAPALDQLAIDNDANATLAAVAPVRVELVAPPNGFLDAALGSLPAIDERRKTAAELDPRRPADLTVFYRTMPPADFSADAAILLIDPPAGGFWGEPVVTDDAGKLTHPIVSDEEKDSVPLRFAGLESISLESAREYRPAAGAEIFAGSFGKPLVFGRWPAAMGGNTGRRWVVLPFDLESTDLVLRTAFPVLIGNLVQSLRVDASPAAKPLPGVVKSRLTATVSLPTVAVSAKPALVPRPTLAWWAWAPLWWWAAALGAGWLLMEWWLYSRRITE